MKIAFYEVEEWEIPYLKNQLKNHELTFEVSTLRKEHAKQVKNVEILSVFIYSSLSAQTLSLMPNLKQIITRSMGFDHIDLEYCKAHGITVCNVPNYGANTVAEHTFSLILAISRQLIPSVERTRRGDFTVEGLRGFDLAGKTIGIIGMGHIGSNVIKIAKGFGMNVVVYSRHPDEDIARKMKISFLGLKELLSVSDIITLHVPYTKKTHHLINKKNIKYCKKGSVIINTARGALIETEAIVLGLEKGQFRAVGLDVLEEECEVKEERQLLNGNFLKSCDLRTALLNHVLLDKENAIITPHNAFNSEEALQTIIQVTAENIHNFIRHTPINTVNV